MKGKTITGSGVAVLVLCLTLQATPLQVADSDESRPRPHRGGDRTRPDAEERWKKLDQDNDGKISRSEWQRNEEGFDRMDVDKDGFLTKEELRSAARELRGKHRKRWQEMDADADGSISRSEWKGEEEIFNRLDANSNGLLSRDELRAARKRRGPGSHRTDPSDKTTL